MRIFGKTVVLLGAVLVSACQHYPLDMTEAEWNRLTPKEQYQARQKQADLDAIARQERAAERERKAAIQAAEQEIKAANLRAIYANPRYGDIQDCRLKNLVVDFHPGWREANPVYFTIARTEDKFVRLRSTDGKKTSKLWLHFRDDGSSLIACRRKPSSLNYLSRKSCGEYSIGRRGAVHQLNIPDILRGKLRCRAAVADYENTTYREKETVIIIRE